MTNKAKSPMGPADACMTLLDETSGEIEQAVAMQTLINEGTVWSLEGTMGRTAMDMIEDGRCMVGKESHTDYWGNLIPARTWIQPGTKGTEQYCRDRHPEILEAILARGL